MTDKPSLDYYRSGPLQLWTARPNGELDWVNDTVLDYFGRTLAQMIEWGWTEVLHPDDLARCGERWGKSLETGEPYYIEFRLKHKDGDFHWHVGRATAQRDADGAITLWVGANMEVHDLACAAREQGAKS